MQYFNLSNPDLDFQVLLESGDAVLMSFLEDQIRTQSSQEPLLVALRAYYLPDAYLALKQQGFDISDQELAQIARESIHLLLTQAEQMLHQFFPAGSERDQRLLENQKLRQQLCLPESPNPSLN
jgi:hypothetical protein